MWYFIAVFLLLEDKFWDVMIELSPRLIFDNSIRWKLYPKKLVKKACSKFGNLSTMWKHYNLNY